MDDRGSFPRRSRDFYFLCSFETGCRVRTHFYPKGTLPRGIAAVASVDHSVNAVPTLCHGAVLGQTVKAEVM